MNKDFDCVEMKRKGQEALRARLAGMTKQQVLEFWAREHEKMIDAQRQARESQTAQQPGARKIA